MQKSVKAFESAIKSQNSKIDQLTQNILKLATTKSTGNTNVTNSKTPISNVALLGVIAFCCSLLTLKAFINPDFNIKKAKTVVPKENIQLPIVKDTIITFIDTTSNVQ